MKITRQTTDLISLIIILAGCAISFYINKDVGLAIGIIALISKYVVRYLLSKK